MPVAIKASTRGFVPLNRALRDMPRALQSSAEVAVTKNIREGREFVIRRTGEKYNLSEATIREHVFARRVSRTKDGARGSLELQVKAIPLEEFSAQVEFVSRRLNRAFGRPSRSYQRKFARVRVALYKGQRARVLPGGFPLNQRRAGLLRTGERVRKRIGSSRDRLTGFRYYTFPRRLTDRLLRETQDEVSKNLSVSFRVAFRKEGSRTLRFN